jgi:membrane-associated phospholipid phosphatase
MTLQHEPEAGRLPLTCGLSAGAVDRRRLIGVAAGLGLTAFAGHLARGGAGAAAARQGDAAASGTYLWLLAAPDALRPAAPGSPTDAEIDELLDVQARRSDASQALVARWGGRQAVLPWLELGSEAITGTFPPGLFEVRAESLFRTAMHDAVVAALDAQDAHARPAPAATDDRITPLDPGDAAGSSFPSIHAAVAGAASTVLAHVVPDASADGFAGLANEAAESRLWAGAAFRSDIEAGLALGRAVGELAIARAREDGSDAVWDGSGWPTGDGAYVRTPPEFPDPAVPLAGTWTTWVLPSGDAIRPAPFPAYGSAGWNAEVAGVRRAVQARTPAQERIIDYWLSKGPNGYYTAYAVDLVERESLGEVAAANALAMVSVAMYDALVAVWDAKYEYWVARPISVDPELTLYIPTPPYPSYPGGFGAAAGAGASVLAAVFPAAEVDLLTSAAEAGAQRGWCGIHYVLDDDVGVLMGCQMGRMTVGAAHSAAD